MWNIKTSRPSYRFLKNLLEGDLPAKKLRLLQAWIDIHEEELMANWALAVKGEPVFPIDPLR